MIRIALVDNESDKLSITFQYVNQVCASNKEIEVKKVVNEISATSF